MARRTKSKAPNKRAITRELTRLKARVEELKDILDDHKRDKSKLLAFFQADFIDALSSVFEIYFPHSRASRDGYDKTGYKHPSPFVAFLQICAFEIFSNDKLLSGEMIDSTAIARGNRQPRAKKA